MSRSVLRLAVASTALAILSLPLCAAALPKTDRWVRVDLGEYRIYSEAGDEKTREVAYQLVRLRHVLAATSMVDVRIRRPIRIFVFRNTYAFAPFRDAVFEGRAKRNSGIFLGRAEGNYIAIDASADRRSYGLMFHELIHLFLNGSMPNTPLWANEGLAEFYSTFSVLGNQATIGTPIRPHLRHIRRDLRPIPLRRLLELTNDSPEYRAGQRQTAIYAQSWLLAHYLMLGGDDRREAMQSYLRNAPHMGIPAAFVSSFGMSIERMELELRIYARRLMFPQQLVRVPLLGDDIGVVGSPVREDEILVELAEFLAFGDPRGYPLARELYEAALRSNPLNSAAHAGLGFLDDQNGDRASAALHFARALECEPPGYLPYLLAAESGLRSLFANHANGKAPPAEVVRVRWLFRMAIDRDPTVARSHYGYGKTFLFEPLDLEQGVESLERSWALSPQPEVALNLVVFHSRRADRAAAESYLAEAAKMGADPAILERARETAANSELHRANELILEGREREALVIVHRLIEEATSEKARASLELDAIRLDDQICRNEQALVFNAAVERAKQGDYASALSLLDTLPARTLSAQVREAADSLRVRINQRLASGPK
jgi:tetratricopeptide (TPR) repeat protein